MKESATPPQGQTQQPTPGQQQAPNQHMNPPPPLFPNILGFGNLFPHPPSQQSGGQQPMPQAQVMRIRLNPQEFFRMLQVILCLLLVNSQDWSNS